MTLPTFRGHGVKFVMLLPYLGGTTVARSSVFSCGWQRSAEDLSQQFVTTQACAVGHTPQHGVQGANLQRIVRRDSDVMFAAAVGCQTDVAAGLMVHFITQPVENLDQVAPDRSRGNLTGRSPRHGRSEGG